jgi:hypothetical protein
MSMSTPMSTAERRQGQNERTTSAICGDKLILFSASTPPSFSSSSTRINALTSGVCGCPRRILYGKLFSSTRVAGLPPIHYIRNRWACVVTRARVYRAILQRRLPATTTTKHIHVILRTKEQFSRTTRLPDTQCMQVSSPCHARRLPRDCQPFLFLGVFPLSNAQPPKRPPSRWGKVASNLVFHLYLCYAVVWSDSLGSRRPVDDPESLASAYSLEGLTRLPLIAIEPYSHSRHASNYLSHPTATSPRSLLCTQAGTCISPR